MASRFVDAHHRLRVWNRSPAKLEPLVSQGAEAAGSLEEIAEAEVVVSMLAHDDAVQSVFVQGELLDQLREGAIHVNMATVSIDLARELARLHDERGVRYIAAPVLGRPDVAAAGKLNILAAGDAGAIDTVQPLFDAMGQKTWRFGERVEQANIVKLAANLALACAIEAMGEGAQLVRSYDVSPKAYLEMLTNTLFAAPAYKGYGALIAEERYSPAGFTTPLGLKDVNLALAAGAAAKTPLPFASVLHDNLLDCLAHGEADLDWAALANVSRRRAGSAGPG